MVAVYFIVFVRLIKTRLSPGAAWRWMTEIISMREKKMTEKHDVSGAPTTGHVWDDDLADSTNQPPRWWMLSLLPARYFA